MTIFFTNALPVAKSKMSNLVETNEFHRAFNVLIGSVKFPDEGRKSRVPQTQVTNGSFFRTYSVENTVGNTDLKKITENLVYVKSTFTRI